MQAAEPNPTIPPCSSCEKNPTTIQCFSAAAVLLRRVTHRPSGSRCLSSLTGAHTRVQINKQTNRKMKNVHCCFLQEDHNRSENGIITWPVQFPLQAEAVHGKQKQGAREGAGLRQAACVRPFAHVSSHKFQLAALRGKSEALTAQGQECKDPQRRTHAALVSLKKVHGRGGFDSCRAGCGRFASRLISAAAP